VEIRWLRDRKVLCLFPIEDHMCPHEEKGDEEARAAATQTYNLPATAAQPRLTLTRRRSPAFTTTELHIQPTPYTRASAEDFAIERGAAARGAGDARSRQVVRAERGLNAQITQQSRPRRHPALSCNSGNSVRARTRLSLVLFLAH
jgi:hypothetical protein